MSVHYVAQLKIEKIEKPEMSSRPTQGDQRDKSEVTQLSIKADDLPTLVTKLGAHIAIISE